MYIKIQQTINLISNYAYKLHNKREDRLELKIIGTSQMIVHYLVSNKVKNQRRNQTMVGQSNPTDFCDHLGEMTMAEHQ